MKRKEEADLGSVGRGWATSSSKNESWDCAWRSRGNVGQTHLDSEDGHIAHEVV